MKKRLTALKVFFGLSGQIISEVISLFARLVPISLKNTLKSLGISILSLIVAPL